MLSNPSETYIPESALDQSLHLCSGEKLAHAHTHILVGLNLQQFSFSQVGVIHLHGNTLKKRPVRITSHILRYLEPILLQLDSYGKADLD